MAFVNAPSIVSYIAIAGQTDFEFGFKWFNTTDIIVYQVPEGEPSGDDKILDPNLYTITPVGANIGGSITLETGAVDLDTIIIQRLLPIVRTVEYALRGDLRASTIDTDQNYQTYLLQDFDALKDQFFQVPPGTPISPNFPYPVPDAYIKYNAAGNALETDETLPEAVVRAEAAATESEASATASEASATASEASATASEASATASEASYQNAILVEQDVIDQGTIQEARVIDQGTIQEARVTAEGDAQEARVTAEGDIQTLNARLEVWNAEAEALTADSFANQSENVEVDRFTSNGDGTFTLTAITNTFSSLHWSIKSGQAAVGVKFQDTWDASTGVYPTQRPDTTPLEPGDLFIIDVGGTIDAVVWFIADWMIRNTTNDGWRRVPQIVDYNAIINIPENVNNAVSRSGDTMSGNLTFVNNIGISGTTDSGAVIAILRINAAGQVDIGDITLTNLIRGEVTFPDTIPRTTAPQGTLVNELVRRDFVDNANAAQDVIIAGKETPTGSQAKVDTHAGLKSTNTVFGHSQMSVVGDVLTITTT